MDLMALYRAVHITLEQGRDSWVVYSLSGSRIPSSVKNQLLLDYTIIKQIDLHFVHTSET